MSLAHEGAHFLCGGLISPDTNLGKNTRRETSERARGRERPVEETAGRVAAGKRGHARGVTKKVVSAPSRRDLVRHITHQGLSERRALMAIGMSASAYRYQPAPDRNLALRPFVHRQSWPVFTEL